LATKYLNDPLVVEILEKYKDEEKQPGFEFKDKQLREIIPKKDFDGAINIPPEKPHQSYKSTFVGPPTPKKAEQTPET
jgi:hypothetical protein